jgi:hypothetical protein
MLLHGPSLKVILTVALGTVAIAGAGVFAQEAPELPPQAQTAVERAHNAGGEVNGDANQDEANGQGPEVTGDVDGGPGTGHEACFAATEHARGVLTGLLDGSFFENLDLPEQADAGLDGEGQAGVAQSLEEIENCGMGADDQAEAAGGPPEGTPDGPPDGVPGGPPEGVPSGPPEGTPDGAPNGLEDVPDGPPEGVPSGPPEDVPGGPPEGVPAGPPQG